VAALSFLIEVARVARRPSAQGIRSGWFGQRSPIFTPRGIGIGDPRPAPLGHAAAGRNTPLGVCWGTRACTRELALSGVSSSDEPRFGRHGLCRPSETVLDILPASQQASGERGPTGDSEMCACPSAHAGIDTRSSQTTIPSFGLPRPRGDRPVRTRLRLPSIQGLDDDMIVSCAREEGWILGIGVPII
jgi:hypothetical protein